MFMKIQFPDCVNIRWANTTGAAVTGGSVVQLADGSYGVLTRDAAISETQIVATRGVAVLTKNTGSGKSFAVGEPVYWDIANSRCDKAGTAGSVFIGTAWNAASTTDTSVDVNINHLGTQPTFSATVSSGQASAGGGNGQVDITVPTWVTTSNVIAQIRSSAGALITNYTLTIPTAGTVRLTGGSSGVITANAVVIVEIVP